MGGGMVVSNGAGSGAEGAMEFGKDLGSDGIVLISWGKGYLGTLLGLQCCVNAGQLSVYAWGRDVRWVYVGWARQPRSDGVETV